MYRPELENLTSDMDEIISEKKLRFVGSSGSSKTVKSIIRKLIPFKEYLTIFHIWPVVYFKVTKNGSCLL